MIPIPIPISNFKHQFKNYPDNDRVVTVTLGEKYYPILLSLRLHKILPLKQI